jgi:hypothetical protein
MTSTRALVLLVLAAACGGKAHPANRCDPTGSYELTSESGTRMSFKVIPAQRGGGNYDVVTDGGGEPPVLARVDERGGCSLELTGAERAMDTPPADDVHDCTCAITEGDDGQLDGILNLCRITRDGERVCYEKVRVTGRRRSL